LRRTLYALALLPLFAWAALPMMTPRLFVTPSESINAIQFVASAEDDHDYVVQPVMPVNFLGGANAEATLQFWFVGDTGATWESGGDAVYSSSTWWYDDNNWIVDGFNNNTLYDGSVGIVARNQQLAVLWGDGAQANARTGDVHAIWGGPDIVTGVPVLITVTWANTGGSSRIMSAYAGSTLAGTETSAARTDMYATWFDDWSGYPTGQQNWMWGTEKQAALGILQFPDCRCIIWGARFYTRAKDSTEVAADAAGSTMSSTGLIGYWPMDEGSGTTLTDDVGALTMTATNPDASFWTTVTP
jgi:hypothetical protein